MSYTIKASEVKPGMVIEWTYRGTFTRLTVERYTPSISAVRSVGGSVHPLSCDTEVEVVSSSSLIQEPMELGARIKAGETLFLRVRDSGYAWLKVTGSTRDTQYKWAGVAKFGPITIIDGDPSWDIETAADDDGDADSDQWDDIETALKHCDRVIDKDGDPWYYLDGDLHVTLSGKAMKWLHSIDAANDSGPFGRS